jgi:isocitrate/methylisocitrate lyase
MSPTDTRNHARERLEQAWATDERWRGIERRYSADEVVALRGSVEIEYSLARHGAEKLWRLVNGGGYVPALGAITGNQAVQMVRAGLPAI